MSPFAGAVPKCCHIVQPRMTGVSLFRADAPKERLGGGGHVGRFYVALNDADGMALI